jgi:hypothetical protein
VTAGGKPLAGTFVSLGAQRKTRNLSVDRKDRSGPILVLVTPHEAYSLTVEARGYVGQQRQLTAPADGEE